jgi:predicted nucleotidyltransferase component of viral defense system
MDIELINKVKRLVLRALISDDYLMETLVLKGGNALDLIHKISKRGSLDLDFSIESDFEGDINIVADKIEKNIKEVFTENGLMVFDYKFEKRPKVNNLNNPKFWGGYQAFFKVIESAKYKQIGDDLKGLRKYALEINIEHEKLFEIQISKYEYCKGKNSFDLDGMTIYVYSLEMILIEKIRAICQQLPEYQTIIGTNTAGPRAKDFFDIYVILKTKNINLLSKENVELIKVMFAAKQVPLHLIGEIHRTRDYHREDYLSLRATVNPGENLKDFDFYFDFVIDKLRDLEPLWIK